MIRGNGFAYAQARMQARVGARLSEPEWDALGANVGLRPFLAQARSTSLAPWLASVAATAGAHEMERILRAHLGERIVEVARWVPERWRDAVRFGARTVHLPAIAHLLADREILPWMHGEPTLVPLVGADRQGRRERLGHDAALLTTQADAEHSGRDRWLAAWRARLPRLAPLPARRLDRLVTLAGGHLQAFAGDASRQGHAGWRARRRFEKAVLGHFRRGFMEPVAVFAYLLLIALEFERLRGALLGRALFEARGN